MLFENAACSSIKIKLGAASGSRCEENNLVMNCQLAWITKLTRWDIGTQTRWMCVCVSARDGNYMFDVLPLYALMCVMNSSGAGVYLSVSLYLSVDSLRSWPSKCQTWFVSMLYSVSIFMCQYDQKEKKETDLTWLMKLTRHSVYVTRKEQRSNMSICSACYTL